MIKYKNMKNYKKILLFIAAAACIVLCCVSASADFSQGNNPAPPLGVDAALERARQFNLSLEGLSPEEIADRFDVDLWEDVYDHYGGSEVPGTPITVTDGETWEECMAALLSKYEVDEYRVGIGYYNTLTGEEKYINGDKYMVSASMFKVPTNMIIADRVSSGEITMDEEIAGAPYSYHQYQTIVNSDNARWMDLIGYLGGYSKFKELQIPYLGNDPTEELGWNYQVDNYYNSKQFIHMLRMLYDDPERFPGIIECMLEATPFSDFKEYEKRNPIAQKYGFVSQNESDGAYHTYITCCGIVYTETPFMIVMFTDNVDYAYNLLGEYAVVMTDYTDMVAREEARRKAEEEAEAARQAEAERQARIEAEAAAAAAAIAAQATPKPVMTDTVQEHTIGSFSVVECIVMGWVAIFVLIGIVLIFRRNMSGRINGFWAVLALLLAGAAMVLCLVGVKMGTVVAKPGGEPAETVSSFFAALCAGRYEEAYSYLDNYETLGLENSPADEESRMLYDALRKSYDYSLKGSCVVDRLNASQSVSFRFLNLSLIKKDAADRIDGMLMEIAESRPRSQVYDSEGNYLQSVTDEVYRKAITEALKNSAGYYTSVEIGTELAYRDGRWVMSLPAGLMTALAGGEA